MRTGGRGEGEGGIGARSQCARELSKDADKVERCRDFVGSPRGWRGGDEDHVFNGIVVQYVWYVVRERDEVDIAIWIGTRRRDNKSSTPPFDALARRRDREDSHMSVLPRNRSQRRRGTDIDDFVHSTPAMDDRDDKAAGLQQTRKSRGHTIHTQYLTDTLGSIRTSSRKDRRGGSYSHPLVTMALWALPAM